MITAIQPYIDLILRERSWSWALVCILYVLAALFVRGWFVNPLFSQIKNLDKKQAHKLNSVYFKNSLLGWFLFFMPLLFIILYWCQASLPFRIREPLLIALGVVSFILSILLHLQAFALAGLSTLFHLQGEKILTDH